MNAITVLPKDKQEWLTARTHDITSTDVSALFGVSPYMSRYELWHRKKSGDIVTLEENQRMTWGNRLEAAIAQGIAEDYEMDIRPMKEYVRVPELGIGSSFDYAIGESGVLEIKNVDSLAYKEGWIVQGDTVEAPPHIELQLQHQLLVSGRQQGRIGALIGGNRVVLIRREADREIHEAIKEKVADFWKSINESREPEPNFSTDSRFIANLKNYAEPGKVFDGSANTRLSALALSYKQAAQEESDAKEKKDAAKAEVLMLIGDSEKVFGDGYTITASVTPPALIEAYTRKAFRNFRVNFKGAKNA